MARSKQSPIDCWTISHVGLGALAGAAGVRPEVWFALGIAYELIEHQVERTAWGQEVFGTEGPESLQNAITDVAANMLGWWIGMQIAEHLSE